MTYGDAILTTEEIQRRIDDCRKRMQNYNDEIDKLKFFRRMKYNRIQELYAELNRRRHGQ